MAYRRSGTTRRAAPRRSTRSRSYTRTSARRPVRRAAPRTRRASAQRGGTIRLVIEQAAPMGLAPTLADAAPKVEKSTRKGRF